MVNHFKSEDAILDGIDSDQSWPQQLWGGRKRRKPPPPKPVDPLAEQARAAGDEARVERATTTIVRIIADLPKDLASKALLMAASPVSNAPGIIAWPDGQGRGSAPRDAAQRQKSAQSAA
jgi:hypothetical protein